MSLTKKQQEILEGRTSSVPPQLPIRDPQADSKEWFKLKWKREIIEEDIQGRQYAEYLAREYSIAYGGGVEIIRQPPPRD